MDFLLISAKYEGIPPITCLLWQIIMLGFIGRKVATSRLLPYSVSSIRSTSTSKSTKTKSALTKAARMNIITAKKEADADPKTVKESAAKFSVTPKRRVVKNSEVTKSTKSKSSKTSNITYAYNQYKPKIKLKPKENLSNLSLDDLQNTLFLFTDGSCLGNNNVRINACPAGWGVVALKLTENGIIRLTTACQEFNVPSFTIEKKQDMMLLNEYLTVSACEVIAELFGPVILPTDHSLNTFTLGADVGSNNTGELSAIGEGLIYIRDHLPEKPKRCIILFDSEYAARSVLQIYNGEKNKEMIEEIRRIFDTTNEKMKEQHGITAGISFVHVKAHSGNVWNERVDTLAKQGNSGAHCSLGRYAALLSHYWK